MNGYQLGRKLTRAEKRNVDNNLTTAAIGKNTHKAGRTHGKKNTADQIDADSGNLRKAADDDLAAHRENLKNDGMSDSEVHDMESAIHKRNQDIGLYDEKLPESLLQGPSTPTTQNQRQDRQG